MENISIEELNKLPKEVIITLYTQMSESLKLISKHNEKLSKQLEDLTERIAILTRHRFGKSSETAGQLSFDLENQCIFNEAEKLTDGGVS